MESRPMTPGNLRLIAAYLDRTDREAGRTGEIEVQTDVRRWADELEAMSTILYDPDISQEFKQGYMAGHMERELLAIANSELRSQLKAVTDLLSDERRGYYGYDEAGHYKHQAYESIRDEILGVLK